MAAVDARRWRSSAAIVLAARRRACSSTSRRSRSASTSRARTPPAGPGDRRHGRAGRRASCSPPSSSRSSAGARCARGSSACARRRCGARGRADGRCCSRFLLFSVIWARRRSTPRREAARNARRQRRHVAARLERGADVRGRADLRGVPVSRLHLHRAAQLARHVDGRADHRRCCSALVHVGSAPVLDLVPLAVLGFGAVPALPLLRARCIRASPRTR